MKGGLAFSEGERHLKTVAGCYTGLPVLPQVRCPCSWHFCIRWDAHLQWFFSFCPPPTSLSYPPPSAALPAAYPSLTMRLSGAYPQNTRALPLIYPPPTAAFL